MKPWEMQFEGAPAAPARAGLPADADAKFAEQDRVLGLPAGFTRAQFGVESDMDPAAVSPKGAQGWAQVMPRTRAVIERRVGRPLDPSSLDDALVLHREVMSENLRRFGNHHDAARAYNGGWDPSKWGNKETAGYVPKIEAQRRTSAAVMPSAAATSEPQFASASLKPWEMAFADEPTAQSVPEPAAPKRTTGQELLRQVGLTGRAAIKGVVAIPAMVGDAVGLPTSKTVDGLLDRVLPRPEGATERVVQDVAGAMTGAGGTVAAGRALVGAAGPVAQGVGRALAAAPGAQLASAVTGAGASGVAREEGAGPVGQVAAGIAGAVAPSLASAVPGAVRSALVGGEAGRKRVAENLRAFGEAGVTPTAGQASESRLLRAVDSILSKTPGGAGPMAKKAQAQAAGIGDRVEEIAAAAAPRTSAEISGRAIKAGIEGDGGFVQRFRARQAELYGRLDRHLPQTTPIEVGRTKAALASLNEGIPDAPALSEWFKNAKIKGIEGALKDDMAGTPAVASTVVGPNGGPFMTPGTPARATMPYESIKRLRTLVGKELENPSLVADVPKSKWKALYAALSDDLGQAAVKASPEARAAWERANAFTRAGMDRISRLESIVGAADPEKIFAAATSGTKEGASRLRAVMQSLRPEEQKQVAATLTRRLGAATPGQQNDVGDVFSSETFLTNLNRLSPEARRLIFGKLGDGSRESIERLAKMAANVREGSRVFANPSGTAGQLTAQQMMGGGAALALLTGHPGLAAAGLGTAVGANGLAKLMQNPAFVRGLARPGEGAPALSPALLNVLSQTELGLEHAEP